MRRSFVAVAFCALLLVATVLVVSGPALAHINGVDVDTQVSADGTVEVESATALVEGYLVVHRDDGGSPGEAIGHVPIAKGDAFRQGIEIPVDEDVWAEWGDNRTVWIALHREAGGEGFDPATDPIHRGFTGLIQKRIRLGKGDRPASIVAETPAPQQTNGTVVVRRVAMPADGAVVLRPTTANGTGSVAGTRSLRAGVHRNVTVEVRDETFATHGRVVEFVAQVYVGGETPAVSGVEPVRVAGETVRTAFRVNRTGSLNVSTNQTITAAPSVRDPAVVTPTPTSTRSNKTISTSAPSRSDSTPSATITSTTTGPGFGVVITLLALCLSCAVYHLTR
jgi:hypothetical protein